MPAMAGGGRVVGGRREKKGKGGDVLEGEREG